MKENKADRRNEKLRQKFAKESEAKIIDWKDFFYYPIEPILKSKKKRR